MTRQRQLYAPNPYTIAQMVTQQRDISFLYAKDAKFEEANALLEKGFHLKEGRTLNQALGLIRKMGAAAEQPQPLEEALATVMRIAEVKEWGYSADEVRSLLPLLMPITDASFAANSDATLSPRILASNGDLDQLVVGGTGFLDPIQGGTADCYLISSMIALAWTHPSVLERLLNSTGFGTRGTRSFTWQFHQESGATRGRVTVTGTVPLREGAPLYARSIEPTESWPALLEKAYVTMSRNLTDEPTPDDYRLISNGDVPQDACQSLVGGTPDLNMLSRCPNIFSFQHVDGHLGTASGVVNKPVMVSTMSSQVKNETVSKETGLFFDHAYALLGVMKSRNVVEHVVLRDPYGAPNNKELAGFAKGPWRPADGPEIELNQRGVIAIASDLFFKHFMNIGWVNLDTQRPPT
jgi:hypothetical protein